MIYFEGIFFSICIPLTLSGCGWLSLQEEVDAGAIIVQEAVPVLAGDTEDSLSDRIREAEHRAFPAALELVASGTVRLGKDGHIEWKPPLKNTC